MAKGGNFEREVCAKISKWWTEGERDDIFYRSAGSGGRFTARKKSGKDTINGAGDVIISDPLGKPLMDKWSIECKTGYATKRDGEIIRWDVIDFLDSKQSNPVLQKMWDQCQRDADLSHREPILIFRRNGRTPCLMIRHQYYWQLHGVFGGFYGDFIVVEAGKLFCVIFPLSQFFEWIPNIRSAL